MRAGRTSGDLERHYSITFEKFARMIEAGHVPVPRPRRRLERRTAGRRRRAHRRRLRARSPTCPRTRTPRCTVSGSRPTRSACGSPNSVSTTARCARRSNAREPIVEEFEQGGDVTLLCRCVPILTAPHAATSRRDRRRAAARARRHRTPQARPVAAQQGRHDPRDPPSGEEQPADDLVAAAPAVAPADQRRGEGRGAGFGAADPHDRPRARVAVTRTGRGHRLHRDRPAAAAARRGRVCSHRTGRCGSRCPATAGGSRRTSPRRCRSCSPSCCRTPSITGSPRAGGAARWWCCSPTTTTSSTSA